MHELCLTILGHPVTKKNSQILRCRGGRPLIVQSKKYRQYEKMVLAQMVHYTGPRYNCPVRVNARYYLKDNRWPDLNNLMAGTADILEKAGIIENDRQIVSWDGSRIMGKSEEPRVEIVITPLTNDQIR